MLRALCLICAALLALATAGVAQNQAPRTPILTVDSDRLYRESLFGQTAFAEARETERALAEENDRIREALEQEEMDLTERRVDLSAEEFRALADEFDAKVQDTYRSSNAKIRELNVQMDRYRATFQQAAAPVLEEIMRESGAAVILEQRTVFVSANAIDITDVAIERINAVLGDELP